MPPTLPFSIHLSITPLKSLTTTDLCCFVGWLVFSNSLRSFVLSRVIEMGLKHVVIFILSSFDSVHFFLQTGRCVYVMGWVSVYVCLCICMYV